MNKIIPGLVAVLALSASVAFAGDKAPPAKAAAAPAKKDERVLPAGLTWVKPMGDAGPEMAYTHGDPKTGAFQMFLRAKAGPPMGWHTHDADYTAVVVQGTWSHTEQGETKPVPLAVGSFWHETGKANHNDQCVSADKGDCVVFIVSDGAQTFYAKTADGKDAPAPAPAAPAKK